MINGATAWTRDISNANLGTSGYFETRIEQGQPVFKGIDLDGEAVWLSQIIDISAWSQVQISVDIAENGVLEGNDYLRLYYKLDGGSEMIFGDFMNDFGDSFQTVISETVSGTNLQVIIRVRNDQTAEAHLIDNVRVFNDPDAGTTLYSRNDRNWNNQNAWSITGFGGSSCQCTPDANSNVIIGSSHSIRLQSDGIAKDLTIQDSGNLFANEPLSLFVGGDMTISSTNSDPLGPNVQNLVLDGSTDQNLSLNNEDLLNLTIDKSGGTVMLSQPLNLLGTLNFVTATDLASNGNLSLVSSSDGTTENASIGTIPSGATVSGDVTVQRYVSGEGEIWRYISSPITNASVADWQDDFPITGNFNDPSTGPGINSSNPSLFYYGETNSGTNLQLGWMGLPQFR